MQLLAQAQRSPQQQGAGELLVVAVSQEQAAFTQRLHEQLSFVLVINVLLTHADAAGLGALQRILIRTAYALTGI